MNEKHIIRNFSVKFQNTEDKEKSLKLPEKIHVYVYIFNAQSQIENSHTLFQQPL